MGTGDPNTDRRDQQNEITHRINEIAEQRAAIEQAKGMLMLVFGIDAEAAFQMLRWQSQHHNVKLRALAEQVGRDLVAATRHRPRNDRAAFDHLVHTAYTRMEQPLLPDVVEQLRLALP
jgi:serine phosphatase RsbU (regulator of sigma subunit)